MKTFKKHRATLASFGAGLALFTLLFYAATRAHGIGPAITIALTGPYQVRVAVTNGLTNAFYEIWWTEFLDDDAQVLTNGAWNIIYSSATAGQTNFDFDISDTWTGFFRAVNGEDLDNDGTPNFEDSRPWDPAYGLLRVTIETPVNGSNVQ